MQSGMTRDAMTSEMYGAIWSNAPFVGEQASCKSQLEGSGSLPAHWPKAAGNPAGAAAEGSQGRHPMRICRKARALAISDARGAVDKLAPNEEEHVARTCRDLGLVAPCTLQRRQVLRRERVVPTAAGVDVDLMGAWPEDELGRRERDDHLANMK